MGRTTKLMLKPGASPTRKNLLDRFFEDWHVPSIFGEQREWVPAFDIYENDKNYVLKAEIPGINPKELDVSLTDGLLTVKGEKRKESEERGETYHRIERRYGAFERSFHVPDSIQADRVGAEYRDGILTLTLPKVERRRVRQIDVK
jgi:HSP20 family protein